jgi:hypothetical protein
MYPYSTQMNPLGYSVPQPFRFGISQSFTLVFVCVGLGAVTYVVFIELTCLHPDNLYVLREIWGLSQARTTDSGHWVQR